MNARQRMTAIVLAGLTVFASGADSEQKPAGAPKVDRMQKLAKAVKEAESKFRAATELRNDDVAGRRAFRAAAVDYDNARRYIGETPKLRLMEANACVLGDRIPVAIYFYRCGLAGDPDDRDLRRGLEFARMRVAYSSSEEREALTPKFTIFQQIRLEVHRWGAILVAGFGVFGWWTLRRWIITRKPWLLALAAPALLVMVSVVVVWLVDHSAREAEAMEVHAVVQVAEVLRSGDGPSFTPVRESPLPPGVEVRIFKHEAWSQVQLADGTIGWLPAPCMFKVSSGRPFVE